MRRAIEPQISSLDDLDTSSQFEPEEALIDEGYSVRSGIDLVSVASVADSINRFGASYLERVYGEEERAAANGAPEVAASALAARFAAKEATIKMLQPGDEVIDWRSIEVFRNESGAPTLRLSGNALRLANLADVVDISVSLVHEANVAGAVVVALCRSRHETA